MQVCPEYRYPLTKAVVSALSQAQRTTLARAFVDVRRSLEFPKPQCSQIELAAEVALHDAWLDKEVDGGG